jgi:predicted nuclease with TOPRIM domain
VPYAICCVYPFFAKIFSRVSAKTPVNGVVRHSCVRAALPRVKGPKDYGEFRETLKEIDRLLIETGIEERFVTRKINGLEASVNPSSDFLTSPEYEFALFAGEESG